MSSDVCDNCGGLAGNLVKERHSERWLCNACLDHEYPELRIGSLRKAFQRPRMMVGKCPNCGCTQEQLEATSLCGCPLCYEALDVRKLPSHPLS